jgi:hypothetical protein
MLALIIHVAAEFFCWPFIQLHCSFIQLHTWIVAAELSFNCIDHSFNCIDHSFSHVAAELFNVGFDHSFNCIPELTCLLCTACNTVRTHILMVTCMHGLLPGSLLLHNGWVHMRLQLIRVYVTIILWLAIGCNQGLLLMWRYTLQCVLAFQAIMWFFMNLGPISCGASVDSNKCYAVRRHVHA